MTCLAAIWKGNDGCLSGIVILKRPERSGNANPKHIESEGSFRSVRIAGDNDPASDDKFARFLDKFRSVHTLLPRRAERSEAPCPSLIQSALPDLTVMVSAIPSSLPLGGASRNMRSGRHAPAHPSASEN